MDYVLKAKEILATSLKVPVEGILDDASLNDVGQIDSLAFEDAIVAIEAYTGKKIDAVTLLEIRSVRDVARILANR